jgi:hypothetical protein
LGTDHTKLLIGYWRAPIHHFYFKDPFNLPFQKDRQSLLYRPALFFWNCHSYSSYTFDFDIIVLIRNSKRAGLIAVRLQYLFGNYRKLPYMKLNRKFAAILLGITAGIGNAAVNDLCPGHIALQMFLYSVFILGVVLLIMWPCRNLPKFTAGIFVVLILHGSCLYFAQSLFPLKPVSVFLVIYLIESIVLLGIMLQILGPGGIANILSDAIARRSQKASDREAGLASTKGLLIPRSLAILIWVMIITSVVGIVSFPLADFRNRNFAYYLNWIGHYESYGCPVLLLLLVAFLWRGYRKGLRITKTVWLQFGVLLIVTLSLGIALYGQ